MIYYTQPHFWDGLHVNEEVRFKKFKINQAVVINCDIQLIPKKCFGTVIVFCHP